MSSMDDFFMMLFFAKRAKNKKENYQKRKEEYQNLKEKLWEIENGKMKN